jgi:uncharacterized protein (TIRG00374 family)
VDNAMTRDEQVLGDPLPSRGGGALDDLEFPRHARGLREWLRFGLGLLLGLIAIWIAVDVFGGLSDAWQTVVHLQLGWIGLAAFVEAISYLVLGAKLRYLVGATIVTNAEAVEMGLVLSGLGLVTPARPAEGLALTAAHLRRRGLTRRETGLALVYTEWFSLRVFLGVSFLNLVAVAAIERDPLRAFWPYLLAGVTIMVGSAFAARLASEPRSAEKMSALAGLVRPKDKRRSAEARHVTAVEWSIAAREFVGSRRRRSWLYALTAGAFLLDVGCLWFGLLAAGARVGFDVALLAITISAVAALVPLIPGGLGVVEATIPAVVHHFGTSYAQGLAAAIAYRVLGTFIPAIAGAGALPLLRRREHADRHERRL